MNSYFENLSDMNFEEYQVFFKKLPKHHLFFEDPETLSLMNEKVLKHTIKNIENIIDKEI